MKNLLKGAIVIALVSLFVSCVKDPEGGSQPYENGVFITHEGAFAGGTGTVSFYNRTVGGIKNDIFALENSGAAVGNILQSMTVINGKAYLMVNNANKVLILDANSFKFQDSLNGAILPRYLLNIDDKKAFLSEWGANGLDGTVKVLDLATKKITKSISTGKGADRMLKVGNSIWVVNGGGFDKDSTVAIIDANTEMVTSKIKVGLQPNSLVQDANGDIWVLAGGTWTDANGKLVQIKNNAVVATYNVPQGSNSLVSNGAKNMLYFVTSSSIYQKDLSTVAPSVWISKPSPTSSFGSLYGLGFDTKSGYIYAADAKNYTSTGGVYIFDTSKNLKDSIKTGIIPNNFWFQ